MQRSKLELYEDVLTALSDNPMTIDNLAYVCNMDCVALSKRLDFLIKNNLVEEKTFNKGTFYALTRRGLAIFKTLEITKKLEKLQSSIKIIERTLQALPAFPETTKETNSE